MLRPVSRLLSSVGKICNFLPRRRGLGGKCGISCAIEKEEGEGGVRCGVKIWCVSESQGFCEGNKKIRL